MRELVLQYIEPFAGQCDVCTRRSYTNADRMFLAGLVVGSKQAKVRLCPTHIEMFQNYLMAHVEIQLDGTKSGEATDIQPVVPVVREVIDSLAPPVGVNPSPLPVVEHPVISFISGTQEVPKRGFLTAIIARSQNGIIGIQGPDGKQQLPWSLPPDLARFKKLTTGHPVIMGRKTFDSIGRPLPKRQNIVVSRFWGQTQPPPYPDLKTAQSPAEALQMAFALDPTPYLIGGGEMYEALWSQVDRVELTEILQDIPLGSGQLSALTSFMFDESVFASKTASEVLDFSGLRYRYVTYDRVKPV